MYKRQLHEADPNGNYKVKDPEKLIRIAKEWGVETEGKDIYDLAHAMSELALLEYGKPFGTQRFLKRAPQHTDVYKRQQESCYLSGSGYIRLYAKVSIDTGCYNIVCLLYTSAFFCIKSCKGRCDGCFSYATLSSYCYFHFTPCLLYTSSVSADR